MYSNVTFCFSSCKISGDFLLGLCLCTLDLSNSAFGKFLDPSLWTLLEGSTAPDHPRGEGDRFSTIEPPLANINNNKHKLPERNAIGFFQNTIVT